MNDEHKEKIYYIQQQADELSAEISKLMKKDADLSEKHLNELIKLGVFISMTCQELLDKFFKKGEHSRQYFVLRK